MQTVRVDRDRLLEIVTKNRDNHSKEFNLAFAEYSKAMRKYLEELLSRVEKGVIVQHSISIPRPEDHTEDYERTIQMLVLSEDDVIELSETDFAQFVRDDWSWKGKFTTSTGTVTAYNAGQFTPTY